MKLGPRALQHQNAMASRRYDAELSAICAGAPRSRNHWVASRDLQRWGSVWVDRYRPPHGEAMELLELCAGHAGQASLAKMIDTGHQVADLIAGAFPPAWQVFQGPAGFPDGSD